MTKNLELIALGMFLLASFLYAFRDRDVDLSGDTPAALASAKGPHYEVKLMPDRKIIDIETRYIGGRYPAATMGLDVQF
jgi:hypothetical protein